MARLRHERIALALAVAALAVSGGLRLTAAASQEADEYRVKAAILYNLAKFVEWPPDAFSTPTAPLTVCVLGVDPFGSSLDEAFRGHLVGGRSLTIKRIAAIEPGCHLLFVSSSEQSRTAVIADQLGTASVLTVSEQDGFNKLGGMVELFTEGDRIRFNINIVALEAARLRASARLREIASNGKHAGDRR